MERESKKDEGTEEEDIKLLLVLNNNKQLLPFCPNFSYPFPAVVVLLFGALTAYPLSCPLYDLTFWGSLEKGKMRWRVICFSLLSSRRDREKMRADVRVVNGNRCRCLTLMHDFFSPSPAIAGRIVYERLPFFPRA